MQRRNKLLIALMIMTVFAGRTQATVDNVSTWSGLSNSITAGNSATLTGDIASDVTSTITNSNSVATAISVDFATYVINANSSTGAILNNGTLTLKSGTLENFKSSTGVSALKNTKNLTIDSQTLDNNKVTSTTSTTHGGGIFNNGTLNIQNSSTVSNNTVGYGGGGIYNLGTTNITGSNVNSNTATSGGGIYNESGTTTIDSNSVLLSNSASSEGGAIYNQGTKVAVSNSTLLNNKVESSTNAVYGGAVSNEAGTLVLDSSYVLNNKANSTSTSTSYDALGAGIYNKATLTVTNSTISGNTATSSSENANGGGIYNIDTTTVTGSTIKSNTATDGGGIYNYYGTTTIDSSTVDGNKATSTTYYAKGGAIYNDSGATLVVKNGSTLSNNSAEDFGGAIYNGGTATISDTTISTNSTNQKNGGGIQNSGTLTVSNSNFNGNTAALYGGAIANDIGATATITDTSFKNNTAGNGGGAIHNEGTVTIIATGSQATPADVVFEGNTEGGSSNAIYNKNKNGVLNLNATGDAENNGRIVFKDKIRSTGTINVNATNADVATIPAGSPTTGTVVSNNDMTGVQGMVKFYNGTIQLDDGGTMFADSATLDVMPNSTTPATINFQNAPIATYGLSNLVLGGDLNLKVKADLAAKQMTQIKATSLAGDGKIIVNDIALTSEATQDSTSIAFADDTLKNTVSYSGGKVAYSPIYKYSVDYDKNTGNFGFTRPSTAKTTDFNPSVLPAPVASQMGGYFSQLNSYNQGFRPMDTLMHLTRLERLSMRDRNKYAIVDTPASGTGSTPLYRESTQKGLWVNPYTTFEDVSIKNGPDVSGISYGSYFGGDSDLYELKHGWEALYSLYAGYNGAYQSFGSVHSDQNGGTLGLSGTWFKGNFFSGLTVNAGGTSGQSHTMYGTDNYVMISSGVAGRLGYNWEMFEGKFVIQPSFTMSYSFVDTLPYTSASNVRITSDALNAITFQPQLKFIANMKNGWQPYAAVAMIWSAMDKSKFYANDQALPEMSIDPFVQYGVGIQRSWADRFTAQGQAMARSGGRNGVALSFILKWAVGQLTDPDLMRRESEEFDRSL